MDDGTFIKTSNNVRKIYSNVWSTFLVLFFISFISRYIYLINNDLLTIINVVKPLFIVFLSIIVSYFGYYIYIKFVSNDEFSWSIFLNEWCFIGILISLSLPISIPYFIYLLVFILINLYHIIDSKFSKIHVNIVALGILFTTILIEIYGYYKDDTLQYLNLFSLEKEYLINVPIALLCAFFYLCINRAIKSKIPVITLSFLFLLNFLVCFIGKIKDASLLAMCPGSIMFMAIFTATLNKTSPSTPIGQTIYALVLATLTLIFSSFNLPIQIGVACGVVLASIMSPRFDLWGSLGRGNVKRYGMIGFIIILFGLILAYQIGIRI